MPEYSLVPHRGVPPVLLGMSRDDVREIMPSAFAVIDDRCDAYHAAAFKVFYSESGAVEYIELSRRGEVSARYGEIDVFSTAAEAVVRRVSKDAPFDPDDPEFGYVYSFPRLELIFWRPVRPEDSKDREAFYFATAGVGAAGYVSGAPSNST